MEEELWKQISNPATLNIILWGAGTFIVGYLILLGMARWPKNRLKKTIFDSAVHRTKDRDGSSFNDGQDRIKILQVVSLDKEHRLVLARCDTKEHLLIVGPNPQVVDRDILAPRSVDINAQYSGGLHATEQATMTQAAATLSDNGVVNGTTSFNEMASSEHSVGVAQAAALDTSASPVPGVGSTQGTVNVRDEGRDTMEEQATMTQAATTLSDNGVVNGATSFNEMPSSEHSVGVAQAAALDTSASPVPGVGSTQGTVNVRDEGRDTMEEQATMTQAATLSDNGVVNGATSFNEMASSEHSVGVAQAAALDGDDRGEVQQGPSMIVTQPVAGDGQFSQTCHEVAPSIEPQESPDESLPTSGNGLAADHGANGQVAWSAPVQSLASDGQFNGEGIKKVNGSVQGVAGDAADAMSLEEISLSQPGQELPMSSDHTEMNGRLSQEPSKEPSMSLSSSLEDGEDSVYHPAPGEVETEDQQPSRQGFGRKVG